MCVCVCVRVCVDICIHVDKHSHNHKYDKTIKIQLNNREQSSKSSKALEMYIWYRFEIINQRLQPHLPGANGLTAIS